MSDYSKGKIYKIVNSETDDVYVGSTTQPLSKRFYDHKNMLNNNKSINRKLYTTIKQIGIEKWFIELIENFPCNSKEELNAREGFWIRQMSTLNSQIAGRTKPQYYEDNKEQLLNKQKTYRESHLEQERERVRQYQQDDNNKERMARVRKEYYRNNIEKFKNYHKEYYQQNKNKVQERRAQRVMCECGAEVCAGALNAHRKSPNHINAMER